MKRNERGAAPDTANARADELLNERFNTLLRDAADKREERSLVQATGDAAAAKQESADLLALARDRGPRRGSKSPSGRE
jgi:hypothetical protein